MSVNELIERLKKFDGDLEVVDMGYDDISDVAESTWVHSNFPYNLPDKKVIMIK